MDALDARLRKLEVILNPVNVTRGNIEEDIEGKTAIDLLVALYSSVDDIFRHHGELERLIDVIKIIEGNVQKNASDIGDINDRVKASVILAHGSEIQNLSASLNHIMSLSSSVLDDGYSQHWIENITTDPNLQKEVDGLCNKMDDIEKEFSLLLTRSVSLFERLFVRSVLGVNRALAEVNDRLVLVETKLKRTHTERKT